ncbi:MAG: hypothetical protein MUF54_00580 [Polyangiaceae bacterium]|jgi:hypothetical protein|nr:hypothetical protein [Polyangiaceae bacterium]
MESNSMPSNEELVRQVQEPSETVRTLQQAQAGRMDRRGPSRARQAVRVTALLTLIAVVGTVAATSLVSADSPPKPGEVVPRQLPYRGYLEKDGVPEEGTRAWCSSCSRMLQ